MEYPTEIYLLIFDQNTYTCNETIQKKQASQKNWEIRRHKTDKNSQSPKIRIFFIEQPEDWDHILKQKPGFRSIIDVLVPVLYKSSDKSRRNLRTKIYNGF